MKLSVLRIQLAVFLSSALLTLWGIAFYELDRAERDAVRMAETQTRGITQAFAENATATIRRIDLILMELGRTWVERPNTFVTELQRQQQNIADISMQVSVVDKSGNLVLSNLAPPKEPINLADREHIRVHFGATESRLFIGKPVKGRLSGKWSLQFTRPLMRDGKFDGVVVISVSPETFSRFYRSLAAGVSTITLMVRDDGEVMARAPDWESYMGRSITGTPYLKPDAPLQGNFQRLSQLDGTERIYGYYRLSDFGLTLVTGVSVDEVLANAHHQRLVVISVVSVISVVFLYMAWLIWSSVVARERANTILRETAQELESYRDHLEEQVEKRTEALTRINEELRKTNHELEEAHTMLLQSEKMASLGQLAAGVAHEINNPIGFVSSNLGTMEDYLKETLALIDAYQPLEVAAPAEAKAVQDMKHELDFEFIREDWGQMLKESRDGLNRVKKIVLDLKEFSHVESQEWAFADLHEGLESTLNIVHSELKYKAKIVKEYGVLPYVECLPGEINQVFMNLLMNAGHAIKENGEIRIRTGTEGDEVWVEIEDTGCGIPPENIKRIFDPFFTTKPVGAGTGLGLSLSYSIMKKHHGRIEVRSEVGRGSTFRICLPIQQPGTNRP